MAQIYDFFCRNELEMFINTVAEAILQNNLSLFLGAGSSMQYNAMNWNDLINKICKNYKKGGNVERAQYAELIGMDVKSEVSKEISLLKIDQNQSKTYLNYLLDFNFNSIWTTNYDCIIETVLEMKGKNFTPIYQYSDFKKLSFPNSNFLFKINGSCTNPNTIIITQEDFIDYRKTHEAYLILLKRELLCNNFLFLGCSFDDDILRICIKDILNCIGNSKENYTTSHYAIIVEKDKKKMDFISKDMSKYYNINCLKINDYKKAYLVSYGVALKVKYCSIFISGAKRFERNSKEENIGKVLCRDLINAFMEITDFPFKFISGMGMSIGHFICGNVKQNCKNKNLSRYLQMEPFPFTTPEENEKHRKDILSKAGIYIFIYGDIDENNKSITCHGMWKEYVQAKAMQGSIIVPLSCGKTSVSDAIYKSEKKDAFSFSSLYQDFNYQANNKDFFRQLVDKIILLTREKIDQFLDTALQ